jgi:serine/threonine protein phosphatase 1
MSSFVISDIHGCRKTFLALLEKINFRKSDRLFLLGDYIDRGPDSKGVIDEILHLYIEGFQVRYLAGNHETMMLEALENPYTESIWLQNGGDATLQSFNAGSIKEISAGYIEFLRSCGDYIAEGHFLLVHAGFNFREDDIFKDLRSMQWIRNYQVDPVKTGYCIVVHGHTPRPLNVIEDQLNHVQLSFEINIDNGCVYKSPPMGNLVALCLEDLSIVVQPNIDF